MPRRARGLASVCWVALTATTTPSLGQTVAPQRPTTLVVGRAEAPSPMDRLDGARRGLTSAPLPDTTLRVAWRRGVSSSLDHPPLVTRDGGLVLLTRKGDLLELDKDGSEQRRLVVGGGPLGPGAILSDGTVVAMTTAGEAVGIQRDGVRFRARIGDRGAVALVAPLPLDDGGVIVASATGPTGAPAASEVVALDAHGQVRARATVPQPVVWPLVATASGVACITTDGLVYVWAPGHSPVLAGSFGGPIDGGALALDPRTLVAVVDARRLVSLDLEHSEARVLLTSTGALLGPLSSRGRHVYAMEVTPRLSRLLDVDLAPGGIVTALALTTGPATLDPDGRIATGHVPVHTATLVDASGTVAFAGPDGHVGVVSSSGMTDLGEVVCGRGAPPLGTPPLPSHGGGGPFHMAPATTTARPSAGFAGLSAAGPGAFLVACEAGLLVLVQGEPAAR